jgi:hypothetical protein
LVDLAQIGAAATADPAQLKKGPKTIESPIAKAKKDLSQLNKLNRK